MKMKRKPWSKVMAVLLMIAICFGAPLLRLPVVEAQAASTTDGLEYLVNSDQTVTITGYSGSATEVQIPKEIDGYPVTTIGYSGLNYSSSMIRIEIPDSVTSIWSGTLSGCSSLTEINVDSGNTVYASIDGVLFDKERITLITCPRGKEGKYIIPDGVTSIEGSAFSGCSRLTSIEIPDSVTRIGSIGRVAFEDCRSLTEINVDSENIVYASVAGILLDKGLTTLITCPGGKEGEYAIPNSVTSIGDSAFIGCSNLTGIEIPSSVTIVGSSAFQDCDSLISIKIPNTVMSIGQWAFYGCSSLTGIEIPNNITSIENNTFSSCSSLTSIKIPENVTSIGQNAFSSCNNLTDVEIPNSVINIGSSAFQDCDSLISIKIPDNVTIIEDYTFEDCSSLISVEIPDSVITIGTSAFGDCGSLTGIEIPKSVLSIEKWAFYGCSSLTAINVDPENTVYASDAGVLLNKGLNTLISCPEGKEGKYSIPDSVTSIGDAAFEYCSSLISVEIPNSVVSVGSQAFYFCRGLTSIDIPNSVISIGADAFRGCWNLTSIEISESITSIGEAAFEDCSSLTEINVNPENTVYAADAGVLLDKGLNTLIDCPEGKEGKYNIPNSVTGIGDMAFYQCRSLIGIEIPDNVISIGSAAFSCCSSLISIEIPNNVMNIGRSAFYECSSLTSIEIPDSITSIKSDTFYYCEGLTNVKLSQSVTSIDDGAFEYCSSLASIEIPDSVTSIGDWAFMNCSSLKSIKIPDSVTSIGRKAFWGTDVEHVVYGGSENAWNLLIAGSENDIVKSATVHYNITEDVFIQKGMVLPDCLNYGYTTYECPLCKKEYVLDFIFPIGHSFENDVCNKCGRNKEDCIESAHPYQDNTDKTYIIARPEAAEIQITFSAATKLSGYDTIFIYDKNDQLIGEYYGQELASQQIRVQGDTVKIRLVSDSFGTAYGFAVSDIEVITPKPDVLYGDLDGSGSIDANDALLILRIAAKLQTSTEEQNIAGDVDNSGSVDANDALYVLKKAAKLMDVFPTEAN